MPCCASNSTLVRRAAATPSPAVIRPAASPSPVASSDPILLFPGENPNDVKGVPYTPFSPSPSNTASTNVPSPGPSAVPSRPSAPVEPAVTTPFASLTSSTRAIPQSTASQPPKTTNSPSPTPNQSPSTPDGSSTTTVAVVVTIIGVIIAGVVGYAIFRFHLRRKRDKNGKAVKLRPLITPRSISRPTLAQPDQESIDSKRSSFRRTRDSFGSRALKGPAPLVITKSKRAGEKARQDPQVNDTHKTADFYNFDATDIVESYGSDLSYPSTYAPLPEFDWPVFKPSPAQTPRIHNLPDSYPRTPSDAGEVGLTPPSSSNHKHPSPRRLQNVPFKIPKPLVVHGSPNQPRRVP